MQTTRIHTEKIKQKAAELGFLDCGIARADSLKEDLPRLESWLGNAYHGKMGYMEKHFEQRVDPRMLVPGARSVIVLLQNYHTRKNQPDLSVPVISKYAYGKDYHKLVKKKLKKLDEYIREISGTQGDSAGRCFVDSAPVMERSWGRVAGLGWIGKNSLLLNRKYGSWFFIGTIITPLELEYDRPVSEYCGDCTRCVDACPTGAIVADRVVDSSRCISYLTIELKSDDLPRVFRERMRNRVFGCDICQDVCPWNKNAHPHDELWLEPRPGLLELTRKDWLEMDEKRFDVLFEGSAVKRAKFSGLRRNIDFITRD